MPPSRCLFVRPPQSRPLVSWHHNGYRKLDIRAASSSSATRVSWVQLAQFGFLSTPCRLQIWHRRRRSNFSFLSVSILSARLRTVFVAVALPKRPWSFVPKGKKFSALPAVRAGTFIFSQARSKVVSRKSLANGGVLLPASKGLTPELMDKFFGIANGKFQIEKSEICDDVTRYGYLRSGTRIAANVFSSSEGLPFRLKASEGHEP